MIREGDPLTERQLEILIAMAAGDTTAQTARDLRLCFETVKEHRKAVRTKLGARTAAHAVALAYHRGLLTPMVRPELLVAA